MFWYFEPRTITQNSRDHTPFFPSSYASRTCLVDARPSESFLWRPVFDYWIGIWFQTKSKEFNTQTAGFDTQMGVGGRGGGVVSTLKRRSSTFWRRSSTIRATVRQRSKGRKEYTREMITQKRAKGHTSFQERPLTDTVKYKMPRPAPEHVLNIVYYLPSVETYVTRIWTLMLAFWRMPAVLPLSWSTAVEEVSTTSFTMKILNLTGISSCLC